MKKGTKLYSILTSTCPQCQEEKMFQSSIYNLGKMGKMNKTCSNCGLKYAKEPSFFTGATYVSYAFTVSIVISCFVASKILYGTVDTSKLIWVVIALAVVLAPLNFRMSRNVWINFFVKYKKSPK